MSQVAAVRGMHDILPEEVGWWRALEEHVSAVLGAYGYREIRLPVVEQTVLFSRAIGAATDIVEKEMYSFESRSGESLSLRPEGTAGCVRAAAHGLLGAPQRLWYAGPMFRYERPQRGRQRQFHQVGVEVFGADSPDVEAELILVGERLWRQLGIDRSVTLQINSLGGGEARSAFREALVEYLRDVADDLDEDSRRRLETNPLRILDSKSEATRALLEKAPALPDYLDRESADHFARLRELLAAAGVSCQVNPRLVRGLDYYNRTVFEWVTDDLGAQDAVCAGGRYDGLVEQLGGRATPAAGFAMGMERLILMMQAGSASEPTPPRADVYVVAAGDAARTAAFRLAEELRDSLPGAAVMSHCGEGGFKSQMKRADKSGAACAVILGEDELKAGTAGLKPLRDRGSGQVSLPADKLAAAIQELINLEPA